MCGLLGWVGAITCGVMLILMYWDAIVNTSVFLAIAAAVVPLSGFIIAYFIAKVVCFVSNTDDDSYGDDSSDAFFFFFFFRQGIY